MLIAAEDTVIKYPTKTQTARNVVAIWANRVLAIAAPLVTTPLIVAHFGLETTGIWLLASQLASHLMLLDIGLGTSLIRLLARSKALGDDKLASEYLSTAFYSLAACSAVLLLFAFWIGRLFVHLFDIGETLAATAHVLAIVTVIYVTFSLPLRIGYGLVGSSHRFDRIQLWDAIGVAGRVLLIVAIFMLFKPSVLVLALVVFGTSTFTAAATLVDGKRLNAQWSLAPRNVSREALRSLFSMSGASLIATAAAVLLTQGASLFTGSVLGPSAVPLIAYPLMIFTALTPFFNTFGTLASPVAAGLAARNEQQRMLPGFLVITRYLTSATVALVIFVVTLGGMLLELWLPRSQVGPADIRVMSVALGIIVSGFAMSALSPLSRSILSSVGHHWSAAIAEIVTTIAGLAAGFVLMRWTSLGVVAMAVGVCLALCVRGLVWMPALLSSYFGISAFTIVRNSLGRPALTALIAAVAGIALHLAGPGMGVEARGTALLSFLASGVAWVVSTWLLVVPQEHRQLVLGHLGKYAARVRGS